jgi:hypothetical protein
MCVCVCVCVRLGVTQTWETVPTDFVLWLRLYARHHALTLPILQLAMLYMCNPQHIPVSMATNAGTKAVRVSFLVCTS